MTLRGVTSPVSSGATAPGVLRLSGCAGSGGGDGAVYTCGITPYDVTHLGHAATFVWADVLVSLWRLCHVEAVTCRNVTDVDDVLTRAAHQHGGDVAQFALEQQ